MAIGNVIDKAFLVRPTLCVTSFPERKAMMKRSEIEKLTSMATGIRLPGEWRSGGAVIVDCYWDPATNKAYEIVVGGKQYRETPRPKNPGDIVHCGPWKELEDE